jgi:hypothetical protein
MIEGVTAIAVANVADCGRMVAELQRFHDENRAHYEVMKTWAATPDEERDFEERFGERSRAATRRAGDALAQCPEATVVLQSFVMPDVAPPTPVIEAFAARWIVVFEEVADLAVKHAADCAAMEAAFRRHFDDNRAVYEESRRHEGDVALANHLMELYGKRIEDAMKRLMGPVMACPDAGKALQPQ